MIATVCHILRSLALGILLATQLALARPHRGRQIQVKDFARVGYSFLTRCTVRHGLEHAV